MEKLKKIILFVAFTFSIITPLSIYAQEKCFVLLENKTDFPSNLIVAMTTSIISQFVKEVEQVPLSGIDEKKNKCVYVVNFEKTGDTTFLVLNGPNLNAYGDSKLEGADAAQQALLKALYRSIPAQQNNICELYDEFIKKCDDKKIITTNKIKKNQDDLEEPEEKIKVNEKNNKSDYFKLIGGYFSTTSNLTGTDLYSQYNADTVFEESINSNGIIGIIYRFFIKDFLSLDASYSSTSVNSIEYDKVQNPSATTDYTTQNNVTGYISTLHLLVNYNWFGGGDSWMGESWSIFAGGGYGSTASSYNYEKDVILTNEKYYTNTLNVSGLALSFGFDYTFSNNVISGLYYASTTGTPSGTRVDDLTSIGYGVTANNSLVNFSLGYNFR